MYLIKIAIGDIAALKTDQEKLKRICTGFTIRDKGVVCYELAQGSTSTWHYEFEIEFTESKQTIGFKK